MDENLTFSSAWIVSCLATISEFAKRNPLYEIAISDNKQLVTLWKPFRITFATCHFIGIDEISGNLYIRSGNSLVVLFDQDCRCSVGI